MAEVMGLGLRCFVKPARSGSSLGVVRVDDWADCRPPSHRDAVDSKVLIEEAILAAR